MSEDEEGLDIEAIHVLSAVYFICLFIYFIPSSLHPQPEHSDVLGTTGNLLLDRSAGAKIVVTPNVEFGYETKSHSVKSLKEMVFEYAEKLR